MSNDERHESERIAFGRAIVKARKRIGVSQEQLANEAQIDRSYMGRIEHGEQSVSFDKILYVSRALGISPAMLFESMLQQDEPAVSLS